MKTKRLPVILSAVIAIMGIVIILALVSVGQYKAKLSELTGLNTYFEEQALQSDFAYGACKAEIDNLEQIIASKDKLIMELKITEGVLGLYKDNLEYTLTWVKYADELLTFNKIPHFDYIGQTVLSDNDWQEIEEQVELFDYVESGEEVE